MKTPKIILAGLLGISAGGAAQAQTILHLTGSTAFRTAVNTAILDSMPGATYAYVGGSYTGASETIVSGTNKATGIPCIVKTYWSGSLAGIETVSQAYPSSVSSFLTNTTPMSTTGTSIPAASAVFDPPTQPEVCMNDGYQFDSQYPLPALTEQAVGVVSFVFVKNSTGVANAAGLTNMTPLLAQALWLNGKLPLSMWTGNTNDLNTLVYATGRDPDSGTRKTAFLETGIQNFVQAPLQLTQVIQSEPLNSSGAVVNSATNGPVSSLINWPAETVDNIPFPVGDGGYNSGGQLAAALSVSSPYIMVSYLGLSDDTTLTNAVGSSANLSYNGTYYSHAATQNGQYTYWTYEFIGWLPSYIGSGNAYDIATNLSKIISTENLTGVGEALTNMNVVRSQEGGIVTP